MVWFFIMGVMTALDTLAAQANGAGDVVALHRWGLCATIVMCGLCIPGCTLLWLSEWVVHNVFGQGEAMAAMTWQYCSGLALGLPGYGLFTVVQKYQQAQGRVAPSIYVLLFSNVLNVATNYSFIWGIGWGFAGSPLGTSLVRTVAFFLLAAWEVVQSRAVGTQSDGRACTRLGGSTGSLLPPWLLSSLGVFLLLGLPGGVMMGVEAWFFDVQSVLAGKMGEVSLDANVVLLSIASLAFTTFPFGVSTAATIIVGNQLGAQAPRRARATATACLCLGVGFMALCGLAMYASRNYVAYIFTSDDIIAKRVAEVAPVVALFQVVDGYQGVASGVLRGLGRQPIIATVNVFSFWIIGMPLGIAMAFGAGMGVEALWIGISIGLSVGSTFFAILLRRVDWSSEAKLALLRSTRLGGEAMGDGEYVQRVQPLRQHEHP